jgi:hypothetical protein
MKKTLAFGCIAFLSLAASGLTGCAADRPLRNGVPNEQLFLRKAFIIRPGQDGAADPSIDNGWMLKATVVKTSTPNPLAESVLFTGAENAGAYVRFIATQDQLQLADMRELSDQKDVAAQATREPNIINTWPAEHGDLKLAVTNDGEKTNQFQENQELDWHQRQWVKVNLAKSDLSDWALFGDQMSFRLQKCAQNGSTSVVPDSIIVDEPNNYIEWETQINMPINVADTACMESFGESGADFIREGRQNVSVTVKYSMTRAQPTNHLTYKLMELEEKDLIRRKYGTITQINWARDPDTQLLGAHELAVRFDPTKELTLYFEQGYPEDRKGIFTDPGGVVDQTNQVFEKAGAAIRLVVKNYNDDIPATASDIDKQRGRQYGDIRYNFIKWNSDVDIGAPFIGVTQFVPDPRTGEALSASINIADFALKEFVAQRVSAYLTQIMCNATGQQTDNGKAVEACVQLNVDAPWGPPQKEVTGPDGKVTTQDYPAACNPGDVAPLLPSIVKQTYGGSSLFSKMQEYMQKPKAKYGALGPKDFIHEQAPDFMDAYGKLVPYYIFADPDMNQFTTPVGDGGEFGPSEQYNALQREVAFHDLTKSLDKGQDPWDMRQAGDQYVQSASTFLDTLQSGTLSHRDYLYKQNFLRPGTMKADQAADLISFSGIMSRAGRQCVDGHWETKEEWTDKLTKTYNALTVWHEFGHLLGLEHNFMGSIDGPNFPHYTAQNCDKSKDATQCDRVGMASSSVMEYSATPDRIFWANDTGNPGWGSYDRAALAWLYGNEGSLSQDIRTKMAGDPPPATPSGQTSPTYPWKDPMGFRDDGSEIWYLYCNEKHTRYSPLCRPFDLGTTPSEIVANELEAYEWQYMWRNFRQYRKVWDIHNYGDIPSKEIMELRRFLPMWKLDWNANSMVDDFDRHGVPVPAGTPRENYFKQLSEKFDDEMSAAGQMVAAFHEAVIQQASGERPYVTIYDPYNGDVTQQGIILDKVFAMQGWVGIWPVDNYNPGKPGNYITSFASAVDVAGNPTDFDKQYLAVAQAAVTSMIGESVIDAFPYLARSAFVQYARDTHNPNFSGPVDAREWVGAYQVFNDQTKLLDFFQRLAIANNVLPPEAGCGPDATPGAYGGTCKYDPRIKRDDTTQYESDLYHEFDTPEQEFHHLSWMFIKDRNQWIFADQQRNTATYKLLRDYNTKVTATSDPEAANLAQYEEPIRYSVDAFLHYNLDTQAQ